MTNNIEFKDVKQLAYQAKAEIQVSLGEIPRTRSDSPEKGDRQ